MHDYNNTIRTVIDMNMNEPTREYMVENNRYFFTAVLAENGIMTEIIPVTALHCPLLPHQV